MDVTLLKTYVVDHHNTNDVMRVANDRLGSAV